MLKNQLIPHSLVREIKVFVEHLKVTSDLLLKRSNTVLVLMYQAYFFNNFTCFNESYLYYEQVTM